MDRRKRKTRQAILQACIELIGKKDFQQISIHELVTCADINRGTFYLHFEDKFDMINSFENELIAEIEQVIIRNMPDEMSNISFIETRFSTIIEIMQCFEQHKVLFKLLIEAGRTNSFQQKLRSKIEMLLQQYFSVYIPQIKEKIPFELFTQLVTSFSLILIQYNLERDEPVDPMENIQFFMSILLQGPIKTIGIIDDKELELLIERLVNSAS